MTCAFVLILVPALLPILLFCSGQEQRTQSLVSLQTRPNPTMDDMVMPYGPVPPSSRRGHLFSPPRLRPLTVEHTPTLQSMAIDSGVRGLPPVVMPSFAP